MHISGFFRTTAGNIYDIHSGDFGTTHTHNIFTPSFSDFFPFCIFLFFPWFKDKRIAAMHNARSKPRQKASGFLDSADRFFFTVLHTFVPPSLHLIRHYAAPFLHDNQAWWSPLTFLCLAHYDHHDLRLFGFSIPLFLRPSRPYETNEVNHTTTLTIRL